MAEGAAWLVFQTPELWYPNFKIFEVSIRAEPTPALAYLQFLSLLPPALSVFSMMGRFHCLASPSGLHLHSVLDLCSAMNYVHPLTASLGNYGVSTGPNTHLPLALIEATLISFLISHYICGFFCSELTSRGECP
jgi:hypothetical protein